MQVHPCGSLDAVIYKHPPHHMLVSFLTLDNRTNLFPKPRFRCDYCQLILIEVIIIVEVVGPCYARADLEYLVVNTFSARV